jgi:hypothetical protein
VVQNAEDKSPKSKEFSINCINDKPNPTIPDKSGEWRVEI